MTGERSLTVDLNSPRAEGAHRRVLKVDGHGLHTMAVTILACGDG
jgi:hypothetical protein